MITIKWGYYTFIFKVNTKEEKVEDGWKTELEKVEEVERMMEEEGGMMDEDDEIRPGQELVKIEQRPVRINSECKLLVPDTAVTFNFFNLTFDF